MVNPARKAASMVPSKPMAWAGGVRKFTAADKRLIVCCPGDMKVSQPASGPVYARLPSSHNMMPAGTAARTALFHNGSVQLAVERKLDLNTPAGLRGPDISGDTQRDCLNKPAWGWEMAMAAAAPDNVQQNKRNIMNG